MTAEQCAELAEEQAKLWRKAEQDAEARGNYVMAGRWAGKAAGAEEVAGQIRSKLERAE